MADAGRSYRLTEAGRAVTAGGDLSVPADYRRILGLITGDTHFDVVCAALRRYPDKLIEEWLTELVDVGYLEVVPSEADFDLDFTNFFKPSPVTPVSGEDARRIASDVRSAGTELARTGAWIAEERLKHQKFVPKPPARTVVLIVEDDPDQLALADLRVSMAGYQVRVAASAKALLEDLRTKPLPDLLLLDIMLPDGNGFDILGKLRKHPKFALLTVALLTAKDDPHEIAKGLALGADAYITKPYSKNILSDTIGRIRRMK